MTRSQRALRYRDGVDYRGQTAQSQNEPSRLTPEAQRDAAIAKGFSVGPAPKDDSMPAVSGAMIPGDTLTCNPGDWDSASTDTISYQWYRGNTARAASANDTIALTDADAGFPVFCRVTSQDSLGSSYYDAYAKTGDGIVDLRDGPNNTVAPVIDDSDGLALGDSLEVNNGTWYGDTIAYAYQWYRDGDSITGADEAIHVIVAEDSGADLHAVVTATDSTGEASASSDTVTGA